MIDYEYEKVLKEFGRTALEKAHRQERKKLKEGWRWMKISKDLTVLVPCNKSGKPTEKGLEIIERYKNKA
jgi:hypothetical protein